MRTRLVKTLLLLLVSMATLQSDVVCADAAVDEVQVREMVKALVAKIRADHVPGRHWEPETLPEGNTAQASGRTALAVLALLEAGEPAQSAKVFEAIKWLAENRAPGTYATAARIMVWTRLPEEFRPLAEADLRILLANFLPDAGGWDYGPNPRAGYVDHSLTQFAMQAIADAERAGLDVPARLIEMVRGRFLSRQCRDGGWGYKSADEAPRGSMTAAGLATMALCERVRPGNDRTRDAVARSINSAVSWLDERFEPGANPGMGDYHVYYWMHALERAGRATGLRYFRERDWFDACAGTIRTRLFTGNLQNGLVVKGDPGMETLAFALFTLTRGLEPMPFGFFDTTNLPPAWDELGAATSRLADVIEKPVGWVRVRLDDPLSAWASLPIVVVRGDGASEWLKDPTSPEASRLLEYAAGGGTVVAAPSDRGRFAKEMQDLFLGANPSLEMTKIDARDEIRSEPTTWKGRADQLSTPVRRWLVTAPKLPLGRDGASKLTEDVSTMMSAICLAETGGLLPFRAASPALQMPGVNTSFPLARYRYDGGWRPEPAVLGLLERFARSIGVELDVQEETAGVIGGPGVLWVTGSSEADAKAIDLRVIGETASQGRRILFESLGPDFTAAMTKRLGASGWSVGPPPAGLPTGTALVSAPNGGQGLIVTSPLSRPLLGRPTKSGVTIGDVVRVVQATAALGADG